MAKNEASLASYYNKRSNKVSPHTFSISAVVLGRLLYMCTFVFEIKLIRV